MLRAASRGRSSPWPLLAHSRPSEAQLGTPAPDPKQTSSVLAAMSALDPKQTSPLAAI